MGLRLDRMRPVTRLFILLVVGISLQVWLVQAAHRSQQARTASEQQMQAIVAHLGLSDLCIATDARYIRNPAVTDPVAPYMDHPGDIEHFPTGSFWAVER